MSTLTLDDATRASALERVADFLERHGVEDARQDARALLLAAERLTRTELLLDPSARLCAQARETLGDYARRRAAREPVSRILGRRGFWTHELAVARDVLDPRPDTETLIESALALFSDRRDEALSILDLGSGSGAIVCALLSEFPKARAIAVDVSPHACALTRANFVRCGVAARAAILRGCWAQSLAARFDLVVSNPPYITSEDIATLAPEVRLHDPTLALDGGGDGLACYREIIDDLPRLLVPGGFAILEAGAGQARDIAALLMRNGLEIAEVRKDIGGRERAVAAKMRRERERER